MAFTADEFPTSRSARPGTSIASLHIKADIDMTNAWRWFAPVEGSTELKNPPAEQAVSLVQETDVTCDSYASTGIPPTTFLVRHTPLTCDATNAYLTEFRVKYPPAEQLPGLGHDTEFTTLSPLSVRPGIETAPSAWSIGVTDTAAEDSPLPVAFTARNVMLYLVKAVSPVIDTGEDVPPLETSAQELPALVEYWYLVIAEPPLLPAVKLIDTDVADSTVEARPVGARGAPAMAVELVETEAALVRNPL